MDRTDRCRLQGGHRTVALVSLRCQTTVDVVGHSRTDGTASLTLRPRCSLSTCNCTVILSVSASAGVFFGYSLLVRLSLLRPSCIMHHDWSMVNHFRDFAVQQQWPSQRLSSFNPPGLPVPWA